MESGSESFFSSLKAALLERIKSPLAGAYIVSWLIVNWRIPYILLWGDGTLTIGKRFDLINEKHLHDNYVNLYVIPIGITLIYALVFPYFLTLIKLVKKFHINWDKKVDDRIFDDLLITHEEAQKLKGEIARTTVEMEILRDEITALNEKNDLHKQAYKDLKEEYDKIKLTPSLGSEAATDTTLSSETNTTSSSTESFGGLTNVESNNTSVLLNNIRDVNIDDLSDSEKEYLPLYSNFKKNKKYFKRFIEVANILVSNNRSLKSLSRIEPIIVHGLQNLGYIEPNGYSDGVDYYGITNLGAMILSIYHNDLDPQLNDQNIE